MMRAKIWLVGFGALALAACSSNSGTTTTDMMPPKGDAGSKVSKDIGTNFMTTTIASLRTTPPSAGGGLYNIPNATIIVSQAYSMNTKWKGYAQDKGMADGMDLYCSASALTDPCTSMAVAAGMNVNLFGIWDPYMGTDELVPVKVTATGAGNIKYVSPNPTTADVGETTMTTNAALIGAPVHLAGGPWKVTNMMPAALANGSFVPGGCTKGPQYFGVEVTDTSTMKTIYVESQFYKTINFTNDANCTSTGTVTLTTCTIGTTTCPAHSQFTTLGGVVEAAGATSPVVTLSPTATSDYTLN